MTVTPPRCPGCDAVLRRDRTPGEFCDPCHRSGKDLGLPAGFCDQPHLAAALAGLDFGPVFLAIRALNGWSQQTLGTLIDLDQCRISDIEKGRRHLTDLRTVVRACNQLRIPAGALGFTHGVTVSTGTNTSRKGKRMDRRDFIAQVATVAMSGLAGSGLDLDRLIALLDPDPEQTRTRHVGVRDVEALERVTLDFEHKIHTYGGGYARDAAVTHLRAILPLLGAEVPEDVRPRLHAAAAHLALQAGWMSFDQEMHDFARDMWLAGLQIAQGAADPVTTDLTAHLLFVMAQQALQLHRPDEALRLVHLGEAAAEGKEGVSPSTATTLRTNRAFAYAQRGDTRGTQRSLGEAQEAFGDIDQATAAPWACVDGEVKLITWQGHARYELGRATHHRGRLEEALGGLLVASDNPRPVSRALYLPDLSGCHALLGDLDTAIRIGHQAVDLTTSLHSLRARRRLTVLDDVLTPMADSPGVAELRHRLHLAGTVSA